MEKSTPVLPAREGIQSAGRFPGSVVVEALPEPGG